MIRPLPLRRARARDSPGARPRWRPQARADSCRRLRQPQREVGGELAVLVVAGALDDHRGGRGHLREHAPGELAQGGQQQLLEFLLQGAQVYPKRCAGHSRKAVDSRSCGGDSAITIRALCARASSRPRPEPHFDRALNPGGVAHVAAQGALCPSPQRGGIHELVSRRLTMSSWSWLENRPSLLTASRAPRADGLAGRWNRRPRARAPPNLRKRPRAGARACRCIGGQSTEDAQPVGVAIRDFQILRQCDALRESGVDIPGDSFPGVQVQRRSAGDVHAHGSARCGDAASAVAMRWMISRNAASTPVARVDQAACADGVEERQEARGSHGTALQPALEHCNLTGAGMERSARANKPRRSLPRALASMTARPAMKKRGPALAQRAGSRSPTRTVRAADLRTPDRHAPGNGRRSGVGRWHFEDAQARSDSVRQ